MEEHIQIIKKTARSSMRGEHWLKNLKVWIRQFEEGWWRVKKSLEQ